MKYLFSLAFKNIFRQKRRTILTFLVLAMGIASYIVIIGFVEGYKKQSTENFIAFDTGHLKIRNLNYDNDSPFSNDSIIKDYREIEKILLTKKYIMSFTERMNFTGEADNGTDSMPCFMVGINPKKDSSVFNLEKYIVEGKLENGSVVIGKNLANDLGLAIGESLFFTFRSINGMYDSVELPISGIVLANDPVVNNMTMYADIKDVKEFAGIDGVTDIAVKTIDYKRTNEYYLELKNSLSGYQVMTWQKLSEAVIAASKADEVSGYIFVMFILIIAIIGIINTMLLSVYEKIKEIGTLKAMGMRDRDIRILFVMEGSLIGILGGSFGIILGIAVNWYFVTYGYDIRSFGGAESENIMAAYRLMGILKSSWNIQSIIAGFVICVAVSIAAGLYPAAKATKLQAAESLRTVQ